MAHQGRCSPLAQRGGYSFETMDGATHHIPEWDLIIAHPPCTYLSGVGTRHFSLKCNSPDKVNKRLKLREEAFEFFMKIAGADCERIAIENPVGYVNTHWRKADQIIEPWHFASGYDDTENYVTKRTCLWLKGIPPLCQTNMLMRPEPHQTYIAKNGKRKNVDWEMAITAKTQAERAKLRSKTFPGIARAMAEQWGKLKIGE